MTSAATIAGFFLVSATRRPMTASTIPMTIFMALSRDGSMIRAWTSGLQEYDQRKQSTGFVRLVETPMPFLTLVLAANLFGILPNDPPALPPSTVAAALHPQYYRVSVFWSDEQPSPGSAISFATKADSAIAAAEAAGMRVFPSIYVGRATWINGHNEPAGSHVAASYPPSDLNAYSNFVRTFVAHYAGHFDYVAVENEENSSLYWGGTAGDYVQLAKAAIDAIHAADPAARITDGGIVSSVWGTVIAKDWILKGTRSRTDSLNWAYGYFTDDQPAGSIDPRLGTASQIGQYIDDPSSTLNVQTWPFVNTVFDQLAPRLDAINFHFYQSPRYLPDVAGWLAQRTGRPVLSNEMSLRIAADQCDPSAPFSAATLDRMAQLVFDYLSTARGEAIGPVIWFSIDTVCDPNRIADMYNASLLDQPPANSSRPSGLTYARMASTLETTPGVRISAGPALFAWQYGPSLFAAWTTGSPQTLTLNAGG